MDSLAEASLLERSQALPVGYRLNAGGRVLAAVVAGCCLAVLLVAVHLPPRSAGVGTHLALGLPECGFLQRTGLPCPACGMTTSFAWFVRGNLAASLYVQPMGTVLAALCGLSVWGAGYVAVTGRPLHWLIATAPPRYFVMPLLAIALAAWGWKIFIHLYGIDGWH